MKQTQSTKAKNTLRRLMSRWKGSLSAQEMVDDIKTILEQPKELNDDQIDMTNDLEFFTDLESSQEIVNDIMFCQ